MDDAEATAASLVGLATIAYARADYTTALTFYRQALDIYENRDEGASIGRTLVSVGNVQYLQAEYDAASAAYRRALALLEKGMDTLGASFARGGLARVFAAQGDIAAALDMYGQVLADARRRAALDARLQNPVATTLESIGELYFRLAQTDRARSHFEEAQKLVDADAAMSARLFDRLGLNELVAGRFDAALAAYTESRARYEKAKEPEGIAHAWVGIGFTQTAREKYPEAMAAYRTAIRLFEAERQADASARAWLGLSLAQSGASEHAAALESAQKVRGIAAAVESEDLAWRSAVRAGEALRKLSRPDDARRSFDEAIAVIDRIAASLPTTPDARRTLDDSASAWTGLAFTLASQSDPAGALAAAEGRRAHARRVQLAAFQRDITRGSTPEEQEEEQDIVRELISKRAQLKAERNARRPDAERLARLEGQLKELIGKRDEQQARLYARLPALREWRALVPPAAATDLDALVPGPRGLIVEYLVSEEEILALTIAHGDAGPDIAAVIVPTDRRVLADAIDQALRPEVLADESAWRLKAAPLAEALVQPLAFRLADRDRIVIVPDDLMWKVPFEALPLAGSDVASHARVVYATSLATLAVERSIVPAAPGPDAPAADPAAEPVTSVPTRIGLAAAPAIPPAVRAQMALTQPSWKEPDAEASLTLAESLAKPFGDAASLKTGADATERAARALIESADVVLLSTPLQVSAPSPLFSSVLLGGDESGDAANDGRLEAREWFDANGRARVMIVPDGSSFGAPGIGGAMDAVAWAAAAAGAPALVLGRWPAEGFVTNRLLTTLHEELAKGKAPADAWTAAVAAARKDAPAPAAWAGLRLIGAW
jgi:tetratricopeptide (TPR) repeat protein